MFAGILRALGIPVGKKFGEASSHNPKGSLSDSEFYVAALNATGSFFATNWHTFNKEGIDQAIGLIAEREAEYDLWGVSVPLLTLCAQALIPYFQEVRLILPQRDFDQMCRSHQKMSGWNLRLSEHLQATYWCAQQDLLSKASHADIYSFKMNKEYVIKNTRSAIRQIARFVYGGLDARPSPEQYAAAEEWVDPSLHHIYA